MSPRPRDGRPPTNRSIEKAVLAFLEARGTATTCPSEIARELESEEARWRPLMPRIREAAARLSDKGLVDAYQHGRPVDALKARGPIRLRLRAAASVDYRAHPERYRIGRGEEGVLTVEPYKSELLPLWRFATPEAAERSAKALWKRFGAYGKVEDFVGMDMARKYLQMGWTRSRRYANHAGGRKYAKGTRKELPRQNDSEKARSAEIFRDYYERALADPTYRALRTRHQAGGRST